MKKIISMVLIFAMVFTICACGAAKDDAGFIKNMSKGLEERWKISDSSVTFNSDSEIKEFYRDCINAELKSIGNIEEYTFSDETLKKMAEQYVSALDSQIEVISYYGSNDNKYTELYLNKGYYMRAKIISQLYDDYSLNVNEKYAEIMEELVTDGRLRIGLEKIITDELTIEALGGTNYEITVENKTDYDFSNSWLYFNLYDDAGILVDNVCSYIESWKAGSKIKASIYSNKQFDSAEMAIVYNQISTEYTPINYINNMNIYIELGTELPVETTYTSFNSIYTKCTVTDFSYEIGYWTDGKASLKIILSGTKTYDIKGDSYSRKCKIGWKLYNANGGVVDSGVVYTSDIEVDEDFIDCSTYTEKLEPGTYKLEILNVG